MALTGCLFVGIGYAPGLKICQVKKFFFVHLLKDAVTNLKIMEKHDKEEYRDSLGQPNPAHDMQIKTIKEKELRDKAAAAEPAEEKAPENEKKAKK